MEIYYITLALNYLISYKPYGPESPEEVPKTQGTPRVPPPTPVSTSVESSPIPKRRRLDPYLCFCKTADFVSFLCLNLKFEFEISMCMCVDFKIIGVKRKSNKYCNRQFFFTLVRCKFFSNNFFFNLKKLIKIKINMPILP